MQLGARPAAPGRRARVTCEAGFRSLPPMLRPRTPLPPEPAALCPQAARTAPDGET